MGKQVPGIPAASVLTKTASTAFRPAHYDLELWKESMRLARQVYEITQRFPKSEQFGLTAQLRRCAGVDSEQRRRRCRPRFEVGAQEIPADCARVIDGNGYAGMDCCRTGMDDPQP